MKCVYLEAKWNIKKVKRSRYRPSVAQRVGRGIALLFHDRGTRRGWVNEILDFINYKEIFLHWVQSMIEKKWFQLFLKGLIIVLFFYVTRHLIIQFSCHIYYTLFVYVSFIWLNMDIIFLHVLYLWTLEFSSRDWQFFVFIKRSFIPLTRAECDNSLPFSGASSIPPCYVLFPATLLHQLFFHPLSPHLAIYFLVYLSILLLPNSYIIPFWEFYFLPPLYMPKPT